MPVAAPEVPEEVKMGYVDMQDDESLVPRIFIIR